MIILWNPDDGADIKNIWLDSVKYFDEKENQVFKVGSVVKVERDLADHILNLYEFVKEIDKAEAIEIIEKTKNAKFRCDQCDFKTGVEIALIGHKKKHEKEARLDDELGIPVILGAKKEAEIDRQKQIDKDLEEEGIIGEGLRAEDVIPKVRF